MSKTKYAACVLCADPGRLEEELQALKTAGIEELHFDVMDGQFVEGFGLAAGVLRMAKERTGLHCNVHLMTLRPERHIRHFTDAGADSISVHVEASTHIHRTVGQIRDAGASPGIALNPATPLTRLEYLLPGVDRVLVMAVDPGASDARIVPSSLERVRILREHTKYHEYRVQLEVEGGIDAANAARFQAMGADKLVLGRQALFTTPGQNFAEALASFHAAVAVQKNLV